jgi:hypothetical protein
MDGRLCGLRHHSKTSTWRTSDHRFGDTISSWPTELRATRNRFDEIRLCAFLVGSEAPSSPMSWVASKRIGAHPRPGAARAIEGSQDPTAGVFDRRSGPGLPLRRLRPSFCSRKLNKSHVAERAAVAARGFKGGRFRLFGQTFKAQRDRERTAHRRVRRFILSGERARLRSGRAGAADCQPRRASGTFACTAMPPEAAAPSAPTARSADACRNAVASSMACRPSGMIIFNSGQACGMSG